MLRVLELALLAWSVTGCAGRISDVGGTDDVAVIDLSLALDLEPGAEAVVCRTAWVEERAFLLRVEHARTALPHRLDVAVLEPDAMLARSTEVTSCAALEHGPADSVYVSFAPEGAVTFDAGARPDVVVGGGVAMRLHAMNPLDVPAAFMAHARLELEPTP